MIGGLQLGPPGVPVANPVLLGAVETPGHAAKSAGHFMIGGKVHAENLVADRLCNFLNDLGWLNPVCRPITIRSAIIHTGRRECKILSIVFHLDFR